MNRNSCEMSVVRIRFVRSSEKVNDDDEKEAEGSMLHFMELQHLRDERLKFLEERSRSIPNKNDNLLLLQNSYFYKKKKCQTI